MPIETLEQLDLISKITIEISDIYDQLSTLLLNKEHNPNYDNELNNLCNKLIKLKKEEQDLYCFFSEDLAMCSLALDYVIKAKKSSNEKDRLCSVRIIKGLTRINALALSETPEIIPNGTTNPKIENYLLTQGFTEEEAKIIALKLAILLEKSIATALNNLHYNAINSIKDKDIKLSYIKRILKQSMGIGDKFEEELIKSRFTHLANNLNEELKNIIEADQKVKQHIINQMLEINMQSILGSMIQETDPDDLDELLFQFKATILHLDNNELISYKEIISLTALVFKFNHEPLLREIDTVINLRNKTKQK